MTPLSIGVVYRRPRSETLWLATDERRLVTCRRGGPAETWEPGPLAELVPQRDLAVDELLWAWGISAGELDALVRREILARHPRPAGTASSPGHASRAGHNRQGDGLPQRAM